MAAKERSGPCGFLQTLGPGLITGAADDDPSGIGTHSQIGFEGARKAVAQADAAGK